MNLANTELSYRGAREPHWKLVILLKIQQKSPAFSYNALTVMLPVGEINKRYLNVEKNRKQAVRNIWWEFSWLSLDNQLQDY